MRWAISARVESNITKLPAALQAQLVKLAETVKHHLSHK
jgi:hypothetical protein